MDLTFEYRNIRRVAFYPNDITLGYNSRYIIHSVGLDMSFKQELTLGDYTERKV
jgi:hypothetical protein